MYRSTRVVAALTLSLLMVACDPSNDDPGVPTTTTMEPSTTTTTDPSITTTTTSPTTTTTTVPVPEVTIGIYPFVTSSQANAGAAVWNDPVYTARQFLINYAGFTRLTMEGFAQGDLRSGEVSATTRSNGPVTTVFVRQIGSGGAWTVIGAVTENIILEIPGALDVVYSPVHVSGRSSTFEGNVVIEIREDGQEYGDSIGFEPLIGGSGAELELFAGRIVLDRAPTTQGGAVMAWNSSAMDGAIEEVAVVKVYFERELTSWPSAL